MNIPLSVLIIEDSDDDTLLIVRELRQAGYDPRYKRVETAQAMRKALEQQMWDIVISDYVMPSFSGLDALKLMQEKGLDLPFIIVTGNITEDMAVEAMKAGAHDCVMKGKLSRLAPAVQRELRESEGRKRRRQAEEKLRQIEERYRAVIEDMPALVCRFLPDGTLTFVNEAYSRYFNKNSAELIGSNFLHFIPEHERTHVRKLYLSLTPENPIIHYEHTVLAPDETIRWQRWIDRAIFDPHGALIEYQSIGEDVTDLKKAEEEKLRLREQLLQAQKMEAIGQLAGGIAHDFNNILTAIMGYVHFLKTSLTADEPARKYVDQILSAAERAANLTQSLLAFSRKQIINPKPVRLNEIIEHIQKLLLRIIGEDVELSTILTGKDTGVMADTGQIEQVLMNLAANARDAMPEGGLLRIETEVIELDEAFVKMHGYGKNGRYVLMTVTDTGTGMDQEIRERIFEPFFTTKEFGRGTGLGLSIVYGIIKQHEGFINVYSEPGKGTTFKIYLPLITARTEEVRPESVSPLAGGSETILLAEDDDGVRIFTKSLLQKFGYTVVEASDGDDALRRFREYQDRIHLLLIDVIMPKKNGKEVYDEITKITPEMKVLFMSGYTADIIHKKGIAEEELDFVLKPVSPTELLRKLRELLDR